MKTHTHTCAKGYAENYKGRQVTWQIPTTIAEAVESGEFADEGTILQYAVAQLNIKKGHAVKDATLEQTKGADGKLTGQLAKANMTLADMEKVAADTKATKSDRAARGTGGQKAQAKGFATATEKAKEIAASATPEELAVLLKVGLMSKEAYDAAVAKSVSTTSTKKAK